MSLLRAFCYVLLLWEHASAYEYCRDGRNITLCGKRRHIVCNPEQMKEKDPAKKPKFYGLVPTTPKVKRVLVQIHNELRNKLACGYVRDNSSNNFPKATRMRELIWDDELTYLAKQHALQCVFDHDECRNTFRFRNSGQNLFKRASTKLEIIMPVIEAGPYAWFNEHRDVINGLAAADEFEPEHVEGKPVGHFTEMSQEYVSRVGCAMTVWTDETMNTKWNYLLTCNYDMTNIVGAPMYKHDAANSATECDFWNNKKSDTYNCLCANNGNMKYKTSGDAGGGGGGELPKKECTPNCTYIEDIAKEFQENPRIQELCKASKEKCPNKHSMYCNPTAVLEHFQAGNSINYFELHRRKKSFFYLRQVKYRFVRPRHIHNKDSNYVFAQQNAVLADFQKLHPVETFKDQILAMHNKRRNNISCGEETKDSKGEIFPKAASMGKLIWDEELEFTASLHAKLCTFAHTNCHATTQVQHVGQNIGYMSNKQLPGVIPYLETIMFSFYNESLNVPDAKPCIEKGLMRPPSSCVSSVGPASGHFTQLIREKATKVGCAVSDCIIRETKNLGKINDIQRLVTCHYDYPNWHNQTIYTISDTPGSGCKSGLDAEYPCLCKG